MDASRLTVAFALVITAIGLSRYVLGTVGRAGDVMAALFVPPDQALGWPHGVQESDEPWAWRAMSRSSETPGPAPDDDRPGGPTDERSWREPASGRFVVPVARVDPVHLGVRRH
jgi:hypothetical protein